MMYSTYNNAQSINIIYHVRCTPYKLKLELYLNMYIAKYKKSGAAANRDYTDG